jgi:hypothetical protein
VTTTATSFPLSKHTGGGDTAPLSQACVFIYSSCGKWVFLPLLWSFPPTATFTSFPTLGCWRVPLLLPSPDGLFIYSSMRDFPSLPSLALRAPCPLCYVPFLLLLLIIQFFFLFSLGGGQSLQGAMLIWPRVVCGSTVCCLAHLVFCIFPSHLGAAVWWRCRSPPGFSI